MGFRHPLLASYRPNVFKTLSRPIGHPLPKGEGNREPFTPHSSPFTRPKAAFTLAEVLITLGIIGIVAAMTLPALVKKYQDKIMLTQVKRAYADVENALKLYAAHNACSDITCISDTSITSEELTQRLFKSLKGATYCSKHSTRGVCKYTLIKGYNPTNNGYGETVYSESFRAPFIVSASGAAYMMTQYNECPRTEKINIRDENGNYVLDENNQPVTETNTTDVCAIIYFDANGVTKGPNQMGADVFQVRIVSSSKKLSPHVYLSNLLYSGKFTYTPHSIGSKAK